jgi:hypothetical protein
VQTRSTSLAWACGSRGTIIRTTDSGVTWALSQLDTNLLLTSLAFVDEQHGWAAGRGGVILSTVDGGQSWAPLDTTFFDIFGLAFLNSSLGWATGIGGRIIRTTDGGASWRSQTLGSPNRPDLYSVCIVDSLRVYAAGERGAILKTIDGGRTWEDLETLTGNFMYDVKFASERVGWAIGGGGAILYTSNGGGGGQPPVPPPVEPPEVVTTRVYPNPIDPAGAVKPRVLIRLNAPARVRIEIVNVLGQRISVPVDEFKIPGTLSGCPLPAGYEDFLCYEIEFPRNLASGAYFLRIRVGNKEEYRKVIVVQ